MVGLLGFGAFRAWQRAMVLGCRGGAVLLLTLCCTFLLREGQARQFGWSVLLPVDRCLKLARACFVVLVAAYAAGMAQTSMRDLPRAN